MKLFKFENAKLLFLPVGLVMLSYLGFIAVKANYVEEAARQQSAQLNNARLPSNQNNGLKATNTPPDATKIEKAKTQSKKSSFNNFKKPHSAINVEITSAKAVPLTANRELDLVGIIKVDRELGPIEVIWHLPSGIESTEASKQRVILKLHEGDIQQVKLKVLSHTNENQQIHLEVSYMHGTVKTGATAQFNTINQSRINQENLRQKKLVSAKRDLSELLNERKRIWQ